MILLGIPIGCVVEEAGESTRAITRGTVQREGGASIVGGDGDAGAGRGSFACGDTDAKESVCVGGFGFGEVETFGDFHDALERSVIDLHDQKLAFVGATTSVRALSGDGEPTSVDEKLEILLADAGQFDIDDEGALRDVDICVRDPGGVSMFAGRAGRRGFLHVVERRIDFAHGH